MGGGASGVAAAVAAAQNGAKTAIIDRSAYLGGKATAAYVGTICGAYYRSQNKGAKFVAGGFVKQFIQGLQNASETTPVYNNEGLHFLPYQKTVFKSLCDRLIKDNGIDLYLQSTIHFAERQENSIEYISILNYDKNIHIKGASFVDCTGDAVMIDLLDLDHIRSDKYQTSTQVFSVNNLAGETIQSFKMSMFKSLQKGMNEDGLTKAAKRLSIMPGTTDLDQMHFKLSIPFEIDEKINRMSTLNVYARSLVTEIYTYLKSKNSNFKNSKLSSISDEVGIRTGRRHLGKKVLKKETVLKAEKSTMSIARGTWPIEHWSMDAKPSMEYFDFDEYYDIPSGCLCSNAMDNLYFAGRNISADDGAIASARVIGTCLQTGFAAGIMASDKVKNIKPKDSIIKVQNKLEF